MLPSKRKAQYSLEALLIMSVILFGTVIIVPNYINSDTSASIVSFTRASAGIACNYLNMGVIVGDSKYGALNALLNSGADYNLRLKSVRYSEADDTIYLTVSIVNFGGISNIDINATETGISNFIQSYISEHSSAKIVNGTLVYSGKKVIINVEVSVE